MWVIAGIDGDGFTNDVWESEDGIAWIKVIGSADFESRGYHSSVVHMNRMWIIGGWHIKGIENDV